MNRKKNCLHSYLYLLFIRILDTFIGHITVVKITVILNSESYFSS